MDALKHFGEPVADDEAHRVGGREVEAAWAVERFAALKDEPFL
jgi:hypothetical protein